MVKHSACTHVPYKNNWLHINISCIKPTDGAQATPYQLGVWAVNRTPMYALHAQYVQRLPLALTWTQAHDPKMHRVDTQMAHKYKTDLCVAKCACPSPWWNPSTPCRQCPLLGISIDVQKSTWHYNPCNLGSPLRWRKHHGYIMSAVSWTSYMWRNQHAEKRRGVVWPQNNSVYTALVNPSSMTKPPIIAPFTQICTTWMS
jgi:hypothetical protein|mmetsp:Transcript_61614/g.101804  ORF Transcript_61614/g.101804 Transcript_61614/m.101804 type:complete len:201 (-) Transcript_61614:1704-2306(-)